MHSEPCDIPSKVIYFIIIRAPPSSSIWCTWSCYCVMAWGMRHEWCSYHLVTGVAKIDEENQKILSIMNACGLITQICQKQISFGHVWYCVRGVGVRVGMVRLINSAQASPNPICPYACAWKLLHVQRRVIVIHAAVAVTEMSRYGTAIEACACELHVTMQGDGLIIINFITFSKKWSG